MEFQQMDVNKLTQELENCIMTKNENNARQILNRLLDFGVYFQFTFEEKPKPPPPIIKKEPIIEKPPVFEGPFLNFLKKLRKHWIF